MLDAYSLYDQLALLAIGESYKCKASLPLLYPHEMRPPPTTDTPTAGSGSVANEYPPVLVPALSYIIP